MKRYMLPLLALFLTAEAPAAPPMLRVCADPNNLPFSNSEGEGFENRIAEMLATDMGAKLEYFWWAQRRGFLRKTLKARNCDVVIGLPSGYEMAATTRSYYRSTYVYVSRPDSQLDLHSMRDPKLAELEIGVHLIGDDGINTPPAHALGEQGFIGNVHGYMIYGDYSTKAPQAAVVRDVASGDLDVAALWGPTAGYFAHRSNPPLKVTQITGTDSFPALRFDFSIAMGTRKDDEALQARLDDFLRRHQEEITALLASYHVPLLPLAQREKEVE